MDKKLATARVISSLGRLSSLWLNPDFLYRRKAVSVLVSLSGFSPTMADALIDSVFAELTAPKLKTLLEAEIGSLSVLDGWTRNSKRGGMFCCAWGPEKMTMIFSANAPQPAISSVVFGLLLQTQLTIKESSRDGGFLSVYLESLKRHSPILAKRVRSIRPSDRRALTQAIHESSAVLVYGSDSTLATVRKMCRPKTRFFGYGSRVSLSYYSKEALTEKNIKGLAQKTADDVWMIDQRGCLSPAMIYVQAGGSLQPSQFASVLADCLEMKSRQNQTHPVRSRAHRSEKSRMKREFAVRCLSDPKAFAIESPRKDEWLVLCEEKARGFVWSSGAQTILVRAVKKPEVFQKEITCLKNFIQAVAVESPPAQMRQMRETLKFLGVPRITRAGSLQRPPALWYHEGRPNFGDWVNWTALD